MNSTPDHSKTYAVVGELVMVANAIDYMLNNLLIEILGLEKLPMLEPVIATLDPKRKIEILKSHAKHIKNPHWKKPVTKFCDKAEAVYGQRNIVCHTPAFLEGETWEFKPVAAAKLLKKLDREKKAVEAVQFNDIKAAITVGEAALGAGLSLLENFAKADKERRRHFPLPSGSEA